ncbi:unnamed protein product [Rhizoctonia solani]|nr:unnamed protein product [Rhizoctonia solani]
MPPPETHPTTHEPPITVGIISMPMPDHPTPVRSTELLANNPIDKLEAPPLPPKEPKTTYSCSHKNVMIKVKRSFGGRGNGRQGAKDAYHSSSHQQRIQDQELLISDLKECLGQRDIHIKDLERLIHQYQRQLQEAEALRQELSSVRNHLRLGDEDEPWVIEQKFGEINKRVDDISVNFSKFLCKASAHRELDTLYLLEQLLIHQRYERKASIEAAYPIEAEEFIELGCRSMLNGLLIDTVLDPNTFNPEWDSSTNELFCKVYRTTQENDAQVNAGRWRISTFNAIPDDVRSYCENRAKSFCDDTLVPFCQTAYDTEVCSTAKELVLPDIVALLQLAYAWSYHTRSTVLMLDFEAIYFLPGDHFNRSFSELEKSGTKSPSPEVILLTAQLGLCSYKALGDGKQECVCQKKAVVSWNDYFCG